MEQEIQKRETDFAQEFAVRRVNLRTPAHVEAFIGLLQHYASGPSGGGEPLSDEICRSLPEQLMNWPGFVSFIVWDEGRPAGLINCFTGFSTFRAKPLLNVHDVVVHADYRRRGVARTLFAAVETEALARGCCKITLEVLAGNAGARAAYEQFGFQPYELDPAMGCAIFMEKKL
ncbi:GNAT family N-acetyltransferase [Uliginosibacterium gangwonense]|uniref:GNAT family N-acetyltransferase n=1 Tax=Uliginosibacterium gangwonense TaxID=392736 RepID=UPI0003618BEB|nr:GNAT family N-acetyltransferase [Uliginosibacterium gangwonense]